ncbi:MAG: fibronectin type III domain-containing protein, partial [Clostridiales Family XIII bacterium]|nr:fibronectin type III domain-containing protein [Clostridiales Family XIII bacterium]
NALAKNNNVPKDQPHYANALIAKFDGSGNRKWMNNYDGGFEGGLYSVVPAAGGGYVAVGCYGLSGTGETGISNNMSISKFDELGNMVWTKNCGGSRDDAFYSVTQAQGGGYIAVGDSSSSDGDMPGCRGGYDMAIARFDENGNKVWMKNYGGSEEDSFSAVIHAASGSYVAVGSSLSSDGNLPGNNGGTDMIIAKFDESGNLTSGSGTNSGGDEQNGHVTAPPPQPSAGATPTQTAQDTTVTAPAKISVAKLAAGKGQVKITWKKSPAAQKVAGYEIRYKEKNAKKWKVKTAKAKATSLTIKKLKKGKVYQIQIRSYKVAGGKKYYAPWSATKTSKKVK